MQHALRDRTRSPRRVTRALVVGILLGLFGFIYFPVWVATVFMALGALLGLGATVAESAFAEDEQER